MRRYEIDAVRVFVFALLILYHVGMFFVSWDWHIKNNVIIEWLEYPMYFVNRWRLHILFVISGMGTFFALQKRSAGLFAWERIKRLFIPLLFGMLVIVPPQVYFERLDKGQFAGNYFEYWTSIAFVGEYPSGNLSWHHLWFLPYLLTFSLILIPLFIYLRNEVATNTSNRFLDFITQLFTSKFKIFYFVIPLYLVECFLDPFFPVTHGFFGDYFTLANFFFYFLFGFLMMLKQEEFWENVKTNKNFYLKIGLFCISMLYIRIIFIQDGAVVHFTEAVFSVINTWAWILAIFGFAATYLQKSSKLLTYCNEAVYPFYILHQTITVGIGYYLIDLEWHFGIKFLIMVFGTFGIAFVIYALLIKPWQIPRLLFGMKMKEEKNKLKNNSVL